ncbi:U3 small nucleolar RNA-associated protein [Lachnellula occidentalis]|uniref:U3 small nucleolar RNA-associated protein n=1 Tax=Lachnellula occidentalis TaxID=215460 RepID=A0A8H8S6P2_9HELO|nr:U3 small nucleolar RNA-associated protein [Lachnellula occidentalis]
MSSMRNAVQRRNHRERGQPEERKKWGLLEKNKDYKLRAADHKTKKTKLKQLKQKVLDKNPDEFYFSMLSRSGPATRGKNRTGTVNGDRGNQVLSQEASRLFKTQDIGYIRTIRNQTTKEVAELEEQELELRVQEGEWEVEAEEEKEQGLGFGEKDLRKLQRREREKLENKLGVARERLSVLTEAEEALEMQRARMAKSPTVGGTNKSGVKFKVRERKR